jgi:outer membrane protein assembly factor BamA
VTKIKASRDRVDRLGYFGDVNIETQEVPGSQDQVDLTLSVIEKPTGSLSLGAGYSSGEGLGLSFGLKQENAFGSGNSLGVQLNTSKVNRVVVFKHNRSLLHAGWRLPYPRFLLSDKQSVPRPELLPVANLRR